MELFIEIGKFVLTGILSGGLVGAIVSWRKSKRDDFDILIKTWKLDNDRLREEMDKLREQFKEIEKSLDLEKEKSNHLQNKIILLESAHHDLPFPMWLKDENGVMLSINPAYEKKFLIPMGLEAKDYLFKKDEDVWGAAIAKEYGRHDYVAKVKGLFIGNETISLKGSDISEEWHVVKYARYLGGVLIGIAGIAIPVIKK